MDKVIKNKEKLEIWIRHIDKKGNETYIRYKPEKFKVEIKVIDTSDLTSLMEYKINWIDDTSKKLFNSTMIDKRCKTPETIIKKLVEKYT